MADYQLRSRIPQELADKLFQVMKEVQEETTVADITVSSMTRAAIEQYIKTHEEKKNRETIVIKIPNNMTNKELNEFATTMELEAEKAKDNINLKNAYEKVALEALRESIRRKI